MKVNCLSVKNPLSYLICAGIKDVENRTWQTDYRGTIYIHSSRGIGEFPGNYGFSEYQEQMSIYSDLLDCYKHSESYYFKFNQEKEGERLVMKSTTKKWSDRQHREYELFYLIENEYQDKVFFREQAIIGTVDIVDIRKDSKSEWAIPDQYHWILENPVLFKKPILFVRGHLRLWQHDLKNF